MHKNKKFCSSEGVKVAIIATFLLGWKTNLEWHSRNQTELAVSSLTLYDKVFNQVVGQKSLW
jgi:hypothetical protein